MFVRVRFLALARLVGLVIPRDAIIGSLQHARVYVVETTTNTASERIIRCGAERNGSVIVLDGLSAGEQVIVTGNNVVTDGARVVRRSQQESQ